MRVPATLKVLGLLGVSPFRLPGLVPRSRIKLSGILVALLIAGFSQTQATEPAYWQHTVQPPATIGPTVPVGVRTKPCPSDDLQVLGLLQFLDGLGRKQAAALDQVKAESPEVCVRLLSVDTLDSIWPEEPLTASHTELGLQLPLERLAADDHQGLFAQMDPTLLRVLPQTLVVGPDHQLLACFRGFTPPDTILRVLKHVPAGTLPAPDRPDRLNTNLLANPRFNRWDPTHSQIQDWSVVDQTGETVVRFRDPGGTPALELRARPHGKQQILFQVVQASNALVGQRVWLGTHFCGNGLAEPEVVLATLQKDAPDQPRATVSPFTTKDGQTIPLGVLASSRGEPGVGLWQKEWVQAFVPPHRLLAVMIFLRNPGTPGAAVRFREVYLAASKPAEN